ncbi:MAG: hypothetical protein J6T59_02170 [Bacteroidales bacterium]|nr:hypothetical protein [Bacteroidales bacterium]MBO7647016.1 hypothetical protein [Bacteroidales bacterium]
MAICLVPITFMPYIPERFPIVIGIVLAVTIAYWGSYAYIEKKRKQQDKDKTPS